MEEEDLNKLLPSKEDCEEAGAIIDCRLSFRNGFGIVKFQNYEALKVLVDIFITNELSDKLRLCIDLCIAGTHRCTLSCYEDQFQATYLMLRKLSSNMVVSYQLAIELNLFMQLGDFVYREQR